MKKLLLTSLIIMCAGSALAQTAGPLPGAHKTNGMPLMQALNERKTTRSFSDQTIDEATLADILWAAVGVNKDGNKRTDSDSIKPPKHFCLCFIGKRRFFV